LPERIFVFTNQHGLRCSRCGHTGHASQLCHSSLRAVGVPTTLWSTLILPTSLSGQPTASAPEPLGELLSPLSPSVMPPLPPKHLWSPCLVVPQLPPPTIERNIRSGWLQAAGTLCLRLRAPKVFQQLFDFT
jgi:hypothetical protein